MAVQKKRNGLMLRRLAGHPLTGKLNWRATPLSRRDPNVPRIRRIDPSRIPSWSLVTRFRNAPSWKSAARSVLRGDCIPSEKTNHRSSGFCSMIEALRMSFHFTGRIEPLHFAFQISRQIRPRSRLFPMIPRLSGIQTLSRLHPPETKSREFPCGFRTGSGDSNRDSGNSNGPQWPRFPFYGRMDRALPPGCWIERDGRSI